MVNTESITFMIPSHIPIVASVFPASGDLPALISFISFLPIIQAGIAAKSPHIIYESIPSTRANIALELAPPPDPDDEDVDGGGGGGGSVTTGLLLLLLQPQPWVSDAAPKAPRARIRVTIFTVISW